MSFEISEDLQAHGKILVNQSKRIGGTQKAKSWLRNCLTCSPLVNEDAVLAVARRTNKLYRLQWSMNLKMQKFLPKKKIMQTRFGWKRQTKCRDVSLGSNAKYSETTTHLIGAKTTRTQCKHSTLLGQCIITKDILGDTKRKTKLQGATGKIFRSLSRHRLKGGRFPFTKKLHLTSKWYHPNRSQYNFYTQTKKHAIRTHL